jgi:hypothetical protein
VSRANYKTAHEHRHRVLSLSLVLAASHLRGVSLAAVVVGINLLR